MFFYVDFQIAEFCVFQNLNKFPCIFVWRNLKNEILERDIFKIRPLSPSPFWWTPKAVVFLKFGFLFESIFLPRVFNPVFFYLIFGKMSVFELMARTMLPRRNFACVWFCFPQNWIFWAKLKPVFLLKLKCWFNHSLQPKTFSLKIYKPQKYI